MAQGTLKDSSTGEVVITPGSAGSSNGGGGFFSIGGGGGFGGGFGSSSQRRRKKQARARAAALAKAKAEEQARQQAAAAAQAEARAAAHRELVSAYSQARETRRIQLDGHYAAQAQGLAQALDAQVHTSTRPPAFDGSERLHLALVSRERDETEGLIADKRLELANRQAQAAAFNHEMTAEIYAGHLFNLPGATQMQQLHQAWEKAYVAAQEARLLQSAITQLSQRSAALVEEHAQQKAIWEVREAERQRQQQYVEQREARVRYKWQADEDRRLQRRRLAATLSVPVSVASAGGVLLSPAGALVAERLANAVEWAIANGAKELLRVAAIRTGQTVSLTATAMLYSPTLGNGELTDAQRRRHLEGLGVRADLLVVPGQDLQAIADAGGSASVNHRIKIEHLSGGSAIAVVSTGADITTDVRVRNAVFDPFTNTYRVAAETPDGKSLVLGSAAAVPDAPASGGLLVLNEPATDVGQGVDLRIDDCIVCLPGQAPQYFSFAVSPAGTGVVSGKGQVVGRDWWAASVGQAGVPVPAQVSDQLRGRTFASLPAFESEVWRAVASDQGLLGQFDELNRLRLISGYPPVAPKATWVGTRREFELRHVAQTRVGSGLYDLDRLQVHRPNSTQGLLTVVKPFTPWFTASVGLALDSAIVDGKPSRTWTPLVPPGAELLGSTQLPEGPVLPGVFPGGATDPAGPNLDILPGENPGDTGTIIPGFGGDTDLPSPGLVNNEPAKPLEVGEYKDLRRRSINDKMDVDHIVSRKALERFLTGSAHGLDALEIKRILEAAPSVVMPAEIHRKYSQTYGARNSLAQQKKDASDLRKAVNNNMDALKPSLLEYGFSEAEIESAREQLHELHMEKGHYP